MGLGTSRLPVNGPNDTSGIEKSVQIVLRALNAGIRYIDTGHNYSAGMAPCILKEAFRQTKRPFSVTVKVQYGEDRTADDARRRAESHLGAMGLSRADFFVCWSIWSYEDFRHIVEKGGIYEGAQKLKDEGIIEHICCSLHAPPEEMIQIIESGAFEGITVSYSLLNAAQMQPVLDAAMRLDIGVSVMNPLGGGLIPQNWKYFAFACGEHDDGGAVQAALRFVKVHPAVNIVLSGVSSLEELEENLRAFRQPDLEPPAVRMARVMKHVSDLKGFCTGCKYCEGCPKGIPTYALMQSRNALLFEPAVSYNRQEPEKLLYDLQIFRKLHYDFNWLPESGENPCIGCGKCEASCTQKLEIIRGVADIYRRAEEAGYTEAAHQKRLRELLYQKGYRRVGLYPSGGFASEIIRTYRGAYGEPEFEWLLFNSSQNVQGTVEDGHRVYAPDAIPELRPDIILICSYKYEDDIAAALRPYERQGIRVAKLHSKTDVPWVF